ncbi:MAG: vitamin K epoxide reductase family protein, partial [Kofleriaceae bacterium]
MRTKPIVGLVMVLLAATAGLVFAGISTWDFVQHLDRQVHDLHCSFIPGGKSGGESGCHVAMMSTYSSVFRTSVWGGIPIALPAMSVFAFIGFYAIDLMITRRKTDPRATAFLALATLLPALTSIAMLVISLSQLGTTCKLCVGIYISSAIALIGAVILWRGAVAARAIGEPIALRKKPTRERGSDDPAFTSTGGAVEPVERAKPRLVAVVDAPVASNGFLGAMFATGVAFVVIPVILYFGLAPDHARFIGTCGALVKPADVYATEGGKGVMLHVGATGGSAKAIEILDPLCPACRAFEQRLAKSGIAGDLDRKAVLFPLDNTCNWMVTEATHPGACTVSEAMLCANENAQEVLDWAFLEQDRIREETKVDPTAAARLVKAKFPQYAACVGSPEVKARLNKSLRWSVANNIRVLTPQLFVEGVKLCDEDVDLGLEYTLTKLLERHRNKTLVTTPLEAPLPTADADKPADKSSNKTDKPADKPKPADKA